MRLFVSVDLPDHLTEAVADVQSMFADASGLSFTDSKQAHLTLKFLGDTNRSRLDEVTDAVGAGVERAGVTPFNVRYEGLGVFPSLDYISVVWLGVDVGAEELTRLHEGIETETTAIGFDPEDHDFTPHVTLARMNHAGGKDLVQDIVRNRHPVVGETRVSEVRLTESELTPNGPKYSTVERFPLTQ